MPSHDAIQFSWFVVHLVGLMAAWSVRCCEGSRGEEFVQAAFLLSFAAIGVSALGCRQFCWSQWSFSASTLAVMVVAAVIDLRALRDA